ncbi:MAG: glycosyltransferase family 9 protein [Terracidiphilus sp.]
MHTQSQFRLLVVRLGAMGDILHALPAVTALRQAHPDWQIGWVVDPRWEPLLKAGNRGQGTGNSEPAPAPCDRANEAERGPEMPLVDRVHLARVREWKRRPLSGKTRSEIRALRQELRAAQYNVVVDLQGTIRSAVIARMSGCRRRIGEAEPREWPARWLFTERVTTRGAHVIEQDVELASAVAGDELAAAKPLLPVDGEAEQWCSDWLAATFAAEARPIAMLVPGAGWGAKRWPPERYEAVAAGLARRGLRVVVNAGPGEVALAAAVAAKGAAVPLIATLPQLIALTRRIALCIGGDTGPLHLACALGRPVVGIYGPTDPSRNGPFGTRARVLRNPDSRRDHTRREAPEAGLLTISPDDVLRAAGELLAEEKIG